MRVDWADLAREDLDELVRYISRDSAYAFPRGAWERGPNRFYYLRLFAFTRG